jgi:biotin carboxylase
MKTLWIVGGGVESVPGILSAKEMGLRVVVSDGNPDAAGFDHADEHFVVSTYDVERHLHLASNYNRTARPLDGVLCVASDVAFTVASIAHELGLPGIAPKTARLSQDKLAMKEHFRAAGVPIPWFEEVESSGQLESLVKTRGLPLVLKPVDSRGARGVLQLKNGIDLAEAYANSRACSPTGRVMVEEFLQGPQISSESIFVEAGTTTPGFSDRNYEYLERFSPYIVENGGEQPSRLDGVNRRSAIRTVEEAAQSLGLMSCTVKGDLVITPEGPKIIEVALRLSGGWFATDQIPLATGVDIVVIAIRLALGEPVDLAEIEPAPAEGVAIRYFFPDPGRVVSVTGVEFFQTRNWVHKICLFVKPGDEVKTVTDHTKRAGFVITTGKSRREAVERAEHVVENVEIKTVPM